MSKIAIYTRVSSARQAGEDRYSLEVQKEKCLLYLKSQGYEEDNIIYFCDAGISGTTIQKRDELKDLLDKIKEDNDEIGGICCYDLSRISRSISDTLEIFKLLKDNQLKLYTVDGAFQGDVNNQTSKIMVSIYSMLNEIFIDQLKEKVTSGMTKSVENGNYYGGPAPLGYKYIYVNTKTNKALKNNESEKNAKKKDLKKKLDIDEDEVEIIKLIFNLFTIDKYSIKNVAVYLNMQGYKTRQGKQFATATVQRILECPTYAGRLFWGKRKRKKTTDEGVRIWKKDNIYDTDFKDLPLGNHPRIIEEDFFQETIERLRSRKKNRKHNNMAQKKMMLV